VNHHKTLLFVGFYRGLKVNIQLRSWGAESS
jgi:hypothetical protein